MKKLYKEIPITPLISSPKSATSIDVLEYPTTPPFIIFEFFF
jgi:hypothetical protein